MEQPVGVGREAGPETARSFWRYLWAWAFGAVLALWMLLAGLSFSTGYHEADEIGDGLLVSAAQLLLNQPWPSAPDAAGVDAGLRQQTGPESLPQALNEHPSMAYSPEFHVLLWVDDRLVWDSHGVHAQLPQQLPLGHQTLRLTMQGSTQEWRVYVAQSPRGGPQASGADPGNLRRVVVFLDPARREALADDIAEHIVLPALFFLPLAAWMLASAIRRGLLPLNRLSGQISTLDIDAGQMLVPQQPYQELGVTVQAINHLVQRLQAQLERERRFAADVAHELRTPLTALVLQARLASDSPLASDKTQALKAVEQGARQAARILSQLLDLARAQSLQGELKDPVDLCALAHSVVSEHAALAHELGQDIALEVPNQALLVNGQATLLALALRNLVDNALRHNPAGTFVEVRVAQDSAGTLRLSVSDDGSELVSEATCGPGTAPGLVNGQASGLGIGLTLVERIAQSQGAQLLREPGAGAFGKRFVLIWQTSCSLSRAA
jgi:two-component system sensor histidine kinase QseC